MEDMTIDTVEIDGVSLREFLTDIAEYFQDAASRIGDTVYDLEDEITEELLENAADVLTEFQWTAEAREVRAVIDDLDFG